MGPESGEKAPAPGALALVQDFVNTIDIEGREEQLADPVRLGDWLRERALLAAGKPVGEADLDRALAVREALRALLVANNRVPLDPDAVATLNRATADARLVVRFDDDGRSRLEPDASGVDGALGRLLAIVYTAMAEGTWSRLKACRRHVCRWAFYDHSKNRSGTWCEMAVCGNRTKTQTYRRRHRAHAA